MFHVNYFEIIEILSNELILNYSSEEKSVTVTLLRYSDGTRT